MDARVRRAARVLRRGWPPRGGRRQERTTSWLPGAGLEHGAEDSRVAGAATEIPGERLADFHLGRMRRARQQGLCGEHHPWRADAALRTAVRDERLLDRVEPAVHGD